jgi:hypothetical protein
VQRGQAQCRTLATCVMLSWQLQSTSHAQECLPHAAMVLCGTCVLQ